MRLWGPTVGHFENLNLEILDLPCLLYMYIIRLYIYTSRVIYIYIYVLYVYVPHKRYIYIYIYIFSPQEKHSLQLRFLELDESVRTSRRRSGPGASLRRMDSVGGSTRGAGLLFSPKMDSCWVGFEHQWVFRGFPKPI